jgi:UDP-2,3-diacylglucosamine hydrolase
VQRQNIYLASDFHLGLDFPDLSVNREKKIVSWLNSIRPDCAELYLVGDIFDFWFEYKSAIPKGYSRLFGKLAEMSDDGVKIHFFTGNHDMWMFQYFQQELGVSLHTSGIEKIFFGKSYFIAHGDGLGPGDRGYKVIKAIFSNPVCQFLFHLLHPNIGLWLMKKISKGGRLGEEKITEIKDKEKEWLVQFARDYLTKGKAVDHFIFGHRHFAMTYPLSPTKAHLHYLGDWLHFNTYIRIDENNGPTLLHF